MLWHSPLSIISSAGSMGKTEGFLSLRNGTKVNGGQQKYSFEPGRPSTFSLFPD